MRGIEPGQQRVKFLQGLRRLPFRVQHLRQHQSGLDLERLVGELSAQIEHFLGHRSGLRQIIPFEGKLRQADEGPGTVHLIFSGLSRPGERLLIPCRRLLKHPLLPVHIAQEKRRHQSALVIAGGLEARKNRQVGLASRIQLTQEAFSLPPGSQGDATPEILFLWQPLQRLPSQFCRLGHLVLPHRQQRAKSGDLSLSSGMAFLLPDLLRGTQQSFDLGELSLSQTIGCAGKGELTCQEETERRGGMQDGDG